MKQDYSTREQSTSNQCIKSSQHAKWCYEKKKNQTKTTTPQPMSCKEGKFATSISRWRKTTWGEQLIQLLFSSWQELLCRWESQALVALGSCCTQRSHKSWQLLVSTSGDASQELGPSKPISSAARGGIVMLGVGGTCDEPGSSAASVKWHLLLMAFTERD